MTTNSNQKIKDIIGWDIVNWSRFLSFADKFLSEKQNDSMALELGSREGGLSIYLADRGFKVICSDLKGPLDSARDLHNKYGHGNIEYKSVDILNIDYPQDSFYVIIFKSVLGALRTLSNQERALNEIYRVLKPGGILLFAENAEACFLHKFLRKKFVRWASYWRYINREDLAVLLRQFQDISIETCGFLGAFGLNERMRSFLGYIDRVLVRFIPEGFRYIFFVYAKK